MIAESVDVDLRGLAFSVVMLAMIAPGIPVSLAAGFFAEIYGFRPIFLVCAIAEGIALLLTVFFIEETLLNKKGSRWLKKEDFSQAIKRGVNFARRFKSFFAMWILDGFSWGFGGYILLES